MTTNLCWTFAAAVDDVQEGSPLGVVVEGKSIALFRVGDEVFATEEFCSHGLARLTEGWQEGFIIECPLHQGSFDVRTGGCVAPPVDEDIRCYAVQIRDSEILVDVSRSAAGNAGATV
jgi:nitrite reductase/ring-hydroxylating ferredoxin subunit